MALLAQWAWVWASSGRWWRAGKPGVLQFMQSERVRHNLATGQHEPLELGGLRSTGSPRLGHDWVTEHGHMHEPVGQETLSNGLMFHFQRVRRGCEMKESEALVGHSGVSWSHPASHLFFTVFWLTVILTFSNSWKKSREYYFVTHENDAKFKFVSINKVLLVTQPCSFIYMVSRAVFTTQGQRWILVTETGGYVGLKTLTIWPFTENVCWPLLYSLEGPSDPAPSFQCVPWQSEHYGEISCLLSRFSLILLFFFLNEERDILKDEAGS